MVAKGDHREREFHCFSASIARVALPMRLNNPFDYEANSLCITAASEVLAFLQQKKEWAEKKQEGKMFGVLVVENAAGEVGFLAAYSGNFTGIDTGCYFVPPILDLQAANGFFKPEEEVISTINRHIEMLEEDPSYRELKETLAALNERREEVLQAARQQMREAKARREDRRRKHPDEEELAAMERESQHEKASFKRLKAHWQQHIDEVQAGIQKKQAEIENLKKERKERSVALQCEVFRRFQLRNYRGETKSLYDVFQEAGREMPPAGAGECAAPKLLQYAYLHGLRPILIAEFWLGKSSGDEVRQQGRFYPACKSKCEPILNYMLQGLNVEGVGFSGGISDETGVEIVYEDDWLVVVNKPVGMLAVPGKTKQVSVYDIMKRRYPDATGPLIVHRLDMDTSGLMVVAKTKEAHEKLQKQFYRRSVVKRYVALLDGIVASDGGFLDLRLYPSIDDRPRQMVSETKGKQAITRFQVIERKNGLTRVHFWPLTGRTHQLRVQAASGKGLGTPILGDRLYGEKADRMYLHADYLAFRHPNTGNEICISLPADF